MWTSEPVISTPDAAAAPTPAAAAALTPELVRLIDAIPVAKRVHMTRREYETIAAVVAARAPCRLLVFGVGLDSTLWATANRGGRTVFLEHSSRWAAFTRQRSRVDVRVVAYGTRRFQWRRTLRDGGAALALDLPADVRHETWDVVLVDAPTGNWPLSIGRMKSIAAAARCASAHAGTDVFVHDCNRRVERAFCDALLNAHDRVAAFDRLRHYRSARD